MTFHAFLELSEDGLRGFAVLAFLAAALIAIFIALRRGDDPMLRKLFASFLLLALSLVANNVAIYGLTIVVLGTLIATTNFMESIAILFFNREWAWRPRHATRQDLESKKASEYLEEVASNPAAAVLGEVDVEKSRSKGRRRTASLPPRPELPEYVKKALDFEDTALAALKALPAFASARIGRGVRLEFHGSTKMILDAVATAPSTAFVIEARMTKSEDGVRKAIAHVERAVQAYGEMQESRRVAKGVQGIVVIPSTTEEPPVVGPVVVLKLDEEGGKIVNPTRLQAIALAF